MNPLKAILQWIDNHSKRFTWALSQVSLLLIGVVLVELFFGQFVIAGIGIAVFLVLVATMLLVTRRTASRPRAK